MTEWLLGLVAGMGLGNLKIRSSSVFLLSQIALAGPHTAQRIALLDGLTWACAACSSADADATLTVNTALLINNLAALGGEEAVGASGARRTARYSYWRKRACASAPPPVPSL